MLIDEFDMPHGRMTQLQWFEDDLESSRDARWRFIFHHEPGAAFCRLSTPNDGLGLAEVSESVEPVAFREGVDIIFRGHQQSKKYVMINAVLVSLLSAAETSITVQSTPRTLFPVGSTP